MSKKVHVYAVLRIEEDIAGDQGISVKEILPTMEEAIQEVERLIGFSGERIVTIFGVSAVIFRKVEIRHRSSLHQIQISPAL